MTKCALLSLMYMPHQCTAVLQKLSAHHIHQVFVPASCTGKLQPLHLSVNDEFKAIMKDNFSRWYVDEIKSTLDKRESLDNVKIDLKAYQTVAQELVDHNYYNSTVTNHHVS